MSQTDDLDAILQRIEDGQQAEENFAALCEILRGGRRREVLQKLAKYNLQIQEVAGGDLQIGDRIYNGWTEQASVALVQAIRSQIAELLQAQPSKTDLNAAQEIADFGEMPSCPYQGLSAFQEENAEFFFGREAFIEDVVREDGGVRQGLVNAVKMKPLVAVVGASGSGKSSLVFAGLLPQLAQETGWLICKLRPGSPDKRSFHNLAAALLSLKAPAPNADPLVLLSQRAKALQDGTVTLQDVVAEILRQTPTTRYLLLVIDQFEELFTLCAEEERQPLLDVLLAGVKEVPGLKIVLTLRADFCGQAYAYRPLADALHEADLKLGSMNREELRSAIEQPATKKGVQLEAGLVDRILDDVGQEPGNLPLLEFALTQLWAKPRQGRLTHQAYQEIGGVAKALANHAEAVYLQLNRLEQEQIKRIFLQLVQLGEGTKDTRRRATRADIENWELVMLLADEKSRLLVTGRNEENKEETVEVAHEALIREWQRLRQWIDENRDQIRQQRRIEAAAEEWQRNNKSPDFLFKGIPLINARRFQKEQYQRWTRSDLKGFLLFQKPFKGLRSNQERMKIGSLALSSLAEKFIHESIKYKLKDLFYRLLGISLLIVFLYLLSGRQSTIWLAWLTLRTADRNYSPQMNQAIKDLIDRGISLADLKLMNYNLSNINLENVDMPDVDLRDSILKNANLKGIYSLNSDFTKAIFSSANLSGAELRNTKLTSANLSGTNLTFTYLYKVDFSNANLSSSNLRQSSFCRANFSQATLNQANLINADISSADMEKISSLDGAFYSKETLFPPNFKPHTHRMRLIDLSVDLSNADLNGVDLSNISLRNTNLSSAYLHNADLRGANLSGANLSYADLKDAHLGSFAYNFALLWPESGEFINTRQGVKRCPHRGSTEEERIEGFIRLERYSSDSKSPRRISPLLRQRPAFPRYSSYTDLNNANFNGADLTGVDLESVDLRGARNLTPKQLKTTQNWEQAIYDEKFCKRLQKELGLKECKTKNSKTD